MLVGPQLKTRLKMLRRCLARGECNRAGILDGMGQRRLAVDLFPGFKRVNHNLRCRCVGVATITAGIESSSRIFR
jgi:hypothetical protein